MKRYIWKKNTNIPTIVVVGAGFAGINFVKAVRKRDCEVVIIDKHNYHHWHARSGSRCELGICEWTNRLVSVVDCAFDLNHPLSKPPYYRV